VPTSHFATTFAWSSRLLDGSGLVVDIPPRTPVFDVPRDERAMEPPEEECWTGPDKRKTLAVRGFSCSSGGGI